MGVVYVLTNPAFDDYVKVGRTVGLEQRLRQLDNTSGPLPFRCVYAVQVDDAVGVERLVHQAFADVRVRTAREFFKVDPQRVMSPLKVSNGIEVTPKQDIGEDQEAVEALEKAVATRRNYSFRDAQVHAGDTLLYAKDESVTATVVGEKKIEFEGTLTSVSKAALTLLHREGYMWKTANGWSYWMKDGETLAERAARFEDRSDGE